MNTTKKLSLLAIIATICFFYSIPAYSIVGAEEKMDSISKISKMKTFEKSNLITKFLSQKKLIKPKDGFGKSFAGLLLIALASALILIALISGLIIEFTILEILSITLGAILLIFGSLLNRKGNKQLDSTIQKNYEQHYRMMQEYIGKDEAYIISIFGGFGKKVPDGKGGTIIRFEKKVYEDGYYNSFTKRYTPAKEKIHYTDFYLNQNGYVYKWNEGDN